jgi:tRNA(His) 5'-end guanylyltransferase
MKLADRLKEVEKIECARTADPYKPLMVRIDGRCFSKFTKGLAKPFDLDFLNLMDATTAYLMKETDAKVAYTQSDEITLSFYNDKENNSNSEYMFGGKFQKLTSVFASMATSYFALNMKGYIGCSGYRVLDYPQFDCRVWNVNTVEDIALNYVWRYRDCIKNSVCMYARSFFSHKQLQGKNTNEIRDMLKELNTNTSWEKLTPRIRFGQMYRTQVKMVMLTNEELKKIPEQFRAPLKLEPVIRNVIVSVPDEYESSILDSERIFKTVNEIYSV